MSDPIITVRSTPRIWTFNLTAIDELAHCGEPALEALAVALNNALMTASQIENAIQRARALTT